MVCMVYNNRNKMNVEIWVSMKKTNHVKIKPICGNASARVYYQLWQLILTNFHEVMPIRRMDFTPHVHTGFELIVPTGPQYRCQLGYCELTVPAGHFLLIQPGQFHIDHYSPGETFLCLHFSLRLGNSRTLLRQLFAPGLIPENQIGVVPFPELLAELLALAEKYKKTKLPSLFFDQIFLAVLQLFLDVYPARYLLQNRNQETGQSQLYYRIYHYFDNCISNGDFSSRGFCQCLKCSPRTLSRICNEYFYAPPHRAFQNYRLDCAQRFLLENPDTSIKEVTDYFQYPNPFYFSRLFKKRFGYPPSRARHVIEIHTPA